MNLERAVHEDATSDNIEMMSVQVIFVPYYVDRFSYLGICTHMHVLQIEPEALGILGNLSTTEPHPSNAYICLLGQGLTI